MRAPQWLPQRRGMSLAEHPGCTAASCGIGGMLAFQAKVLCRLFAIARYVF